MAAGTKRPSVWTLGAKSAELGPVHAIRIIAVSERMKALACVKTELYISVLERVPFCIAIGDEFVFRPLFDWRRQLPAIFSK